MAAFAVAALAPLVVGDARPADLAAGLYLACAAVGLALVVGVAGLPSLAQGAFVATGAVVARAPARARRADGRRRARWAAVAGAAAGGARRRSRSSRLPRAGFAAATWIVSWLVALAAQSLGWLLGGSQGIVVAGGPTPSGHYELALVLTALAALGFAALARAPFGLGLAAAREREPAAAALGVPVQRLRATAVAARAPSPGSPARSRCSSPGVADPASTARTSRSSSSSSCCSAARVAPLGAPAGVVVLGVLSVAADAIGSLENVAAARAHALLAAIMLLGVVSLGWDGIVRPPRRRYPAPVRGAATPSGGAS